MPEIRAKQTSCPGDTGIFFDSFAELLISLLLFLLEIYRSDGQNWFAAGINRC